MNRTIPWNLILSKLCQNISEEDEILLNAWLETDDHRELFCRYEAVWHDVQQKSASYEPDVDHYWNKLLCSMQATKSDISENMPPMRPSFRLGKRFYRIVAAASILLVLTFTGIHYFNDNRTLSGKLYTHSYSSLAKKMKVLLPDGTEVWLHHNTTLSYTSGVKSGSRKVILQGEAYFNVKHDADKPFIVNSNGVSVMVHGTKFNVNSYASSEHVLVSLFEGSVSMSAADETVMLKPGEEGVFSKTNNTLTAASGDVECAKSWADEKLRFENKSLRYVCKYLSKWYSVDIAVDPVIPDNQSYTFTVRKETLDDVMRIMSRLNSIDYRFVERNKLIISPRKNNKID